MRKLCSVLFSILSVFILMLFITPDVKAGGEFILENLEVGIYGTAVVPEKDNFDSTNGAGGYLRYHLTDDISEFNKFSIEIAAEYAQWDFSTNVSGAEGSISGNLDVVPVMCGLLYSFTDSESFRSYIGGGFTGIIINGETSGALSPGGISTIDFDNAIGGHFCAGIDWKITKKISFNVDAKYTIASSDTTETVTDSNYTLIFEDMDMNNFTFRGGLAYKF